MTQEQKAKFLNAMKDPSVGFCFVPSAKLKNMITRNEHPVVKQLPPSMKIAMLSVPEGKAIGPIDNALITAYVLGTIDAGHKFIFDLSDVRAFGNTGVSSKIV
jgi:hypothetical protein